MSLNFDENNPESRKWNIVGAIFNLGGTRTVIKKIRIVVFYRVEPHVRQQDGKMVEISPKPCKQEITIIAEIVLQAGDSKDFTLDLNSEINDRITYLADSAKNHLTNPQLVGVISLRGEIEYFDEIGTRCRVGISRELDFLSKRFTVSDDSDFDKMQTKNKLHKNRTICPKTLRRSWDLAKPTRTAPPLVHRFRTPLFLIRSPVYPVARSRSGSSLDPKSRPSYRAQKHWLRLTIPV